MTQKQVESENTAPLSSQAYRVFIHILLMTFCIPEIVCPNFALLKLNYFEMYTNPGQSFIIQKQYIKKYKNIFSLAISSLFNTYQWKHTGCFCSTPLQKVPCSVAGNI